MKFRKMLSILAVFMLLSAALVTPVSASELGAPTVPNANFQSIWNQVQAMINNNAGQSTTAVTVKPVPAPAPVVQKPAPAPVVQKPAPAPVEQKPAPAPVVQKPTPAPVEQKPAPAPETGYTVSAFEKEVVRLVNIEREKAGLKPLVMDTLLSKGARAKSQDMVDNNYFSHTSPKYGSPFNMMKTFGVRYSTAGENIASGQTTPAAVVKAWMNSPGHRANIMSTKYGKIGVGYAYKSGGNYHHYWTQWFTN